MADKKVQNSSKTVFVSGIFNILHPGHFRFLKYAASLGGRFVIGVLSDSLAEEATISEKERQQNLSDLGFVDEVFILDIPVEEYIRISKPDIVVKGYEFHDQENAEDNALKEYGGKLIFSSGEIKQSGFEQGYEDKRKLPFGTILKPEKFPARHKFNNKSLKKLLKDFASLRICVIGDLIVDNYMSCSPIGMSQEDPTIVVRPINSRLFLGGAGIVAAHAAGLGAKVNFISVSGDDEAGIFCRNKLGEYGVDSHILVDENRPTTQKTRFRAKGKTLLRLNDYSDSLVPASVRQQIFEKLKTLISEIDVLIFSDFSYGALPQAMVDDITDLANNNGIIIAADSQSSSQIGNIGRFKNVSLITPTEHEARLSTNNYSDGLMELARDLSDVANAQNVVITLAEEGLLVSHFSKSTDRHKEEFSDRLPALQTSVLDPAGAGDALLVCSALSLGAKASIWEAVYLGSLASAIQVSRVGNTPIKNSELLEVLNLS